MNSILKNKTTQLAVWIWKDSVLRYSEYLSKSILLDFICIFSQFGSYSILFYYLNLLENGKSITFGDIIIDPIDSILLFWLVSTLVGVLFIITAVFEFLSKKRITKLAKRYNQFCSQRLFVKLSQLKYPQIIIKESILNVKNLQKSSFKDSQYLGGLYFIYSEIILGFLRLIVSFLFLLYTNPIFSLFICIIIGIGAISVKSISQRIVYYTKIREAILPEFLLKKRNLLSQALEVTSIKQPFNFTSLGEIEHQEGITEQYDLLYKGMLARFKNNFIMNMLSAICIIVVLILVGNLVLFTDSVSWSILIAFIFALRFFLNNLTAVHGTSNKISQYYDFLNNYRKILLTIEKLESDLTYIPSSEDALIFSSGIAILNSDDNIDDDII